MSDEWKKRRERLPLDFFEDFKRIEKMMNEFMRQVYKENRVFVPHVYSFSIRRFPNVDFKSKKLSSTDEKQFGATAKHQEDELVDVLDLKEVVAELPSCQKEDIKLSGTGNF